MAGPAQRLQKPKKIEPTKIVFEGIRNRLTLLPIDLQLRFPVISPDGKTLAFLAEVSNAQNIYTYSLDETGPRARNAAPADVHSRRQVGHCLLA